MIARFDSDGLPDPLTQGSFSRSDSVLVPQGVQPLPKTARDSPPDEISDEPEWADMEDRLEAEDSETFLRGLEDFGLCVEEHAFLAQSNSTFARKWHSASPARTADWLEQGSEGVKLEPVDWYAAESVL